LEGGELANLGRQAAQLVEAEVEGLEGGELVNLGR